MPSHVCWSFQARKWSHRCSYPGFSSELSPCNSSRSWLDWADLLCRTGPSASSPPPRRSPSHDPSAQRGSLWCKFFLCKKIQFNVPCERVDIKLPLWLWSNLANIASNSFFFARSSRFFRMAMKAMTGVISLDMRRDEEWEDIRENLLAHYSTEDGSMAGWLCLSRRDWRYYSLLGPTRHNTASTIDWSSKQNWNTQNTFYCEGPSANLRDTQSGYWSSPVASHSPPSTSDREALLARSFTMTEDIRSRQDCNL